MRDWYEVNKIDDNLYLIKEVKHWEKTNIYYFIGETYNLLIDSGTGVYGLKDLLLSIDDKAIKLVTSHVHWDHIGNHHEFDDIYVHELDSLWLSEGLPIPQSFIKEELIRELDSKYLVDNEKIKNYKLNTCSNFKIIKEGDIFDLGHRKLKVIHTPGHSPGHIMLYDMKDKLLVSGDLVYKGIIYCHYPSTNPKDMYKSYLKLIALDIDQVLPGHGESPLNKEIIKEGYDLLKALTSKDLVHGYGTIKGHNISFMI